jgi:hypothetical protein
MPVPHYIPFRQKLKSESLRNVTGGLSPGEVLFEVERGARFVTFEYIISPLIITYIRRSPVHFLRPGQSAMAKGLPYALLSLAFGWWHLPSGLLRTPGAIRQALRGGKDITPAVAAKAEAYMKQTAAKGS